MTIKQRDKILELTKKNYGLLGCIFPCNSNDELLAYLYGSQHPDEYRCLASAIAAYNLFCNDNMQVDDFFDWHGL